MKIRGTKIKAKHVKKAIEIGLYSAVVLSMVIWTVVPSLGL
jgi:hypothetical protein